MAKTYNDALEWAAQWIEDSLKVETNERTVEFGKNMAMTFRAALVHQPPVSERCGECCEKCGHDSAYLWRDGRCKKVIDMRSETEGQIWAQSMPIYCDCECIFPATGEDGDADNRLRFMEHFWMKIEPHYIKKHGHPPPEQSALWELLQFVINTLESVATTGAGAGEQRARRIKIALGYIKRAANKQLSKLPCRVDEMTKRETAIFNVCAEATGTLQFIAREIDALETHGDFTPPAAAAEVKPQHEFVRYKDTPYCAVQIDFGVRCGLRQEAHVPTATTAGEAARNLLPCPFCGEDPIYLTDFEDEKRVATVHHVSCGLCSVQPGIYGRTSKEEAFQLWNTRKVRLERESLCSEHQAEYTRFTFSGCVACFIRDSCGASNPPSTIAPGEGAREVDGSMTQEQVERAALIAESRSIDLETAQELVYLRDQMASTATARASAIAECVQLCRRKSDALRRAAGTVKTNDGLRIHELALTTVDDLARALESLTKGEGEDGPTTATTSNVD